MSSSYSNESISLEEYVERYHDDVRVGLVVSGREGWNAVEDMTNESNDSDNSYDNNRVGANCGIEGVGGNPSIEGLANRSDLLVDPVGGTTYEEDEDERDKEGLEVAIDSGAVKETRPVPNYEPK